MTLSCGQTCIKYIIFVANILFFLLGIAAIGLGVWALVDNNRILILTEIGDADNYDVVSLIKTGAYVLIASGALAVLIGFLGCFGAARESNCLLFLYSAIMVIILIIEITAVVIAIIFQEKVTSELKQFLKQRIDYQYEGSIKTGDPFSLALDLAQVQFMCCGVDSYTDFANATKWQTSKNASSIIPFTCCKLRDPEVYYTDAASAQPVDPNCQSSPSVLNSYFTQGCWDEILKFAKDKAAYVIGVGIGIAILEVLCVVLACCLINAIRQEKEETN